METVIPALAPVISQNGNTLTANSNGIAPNYQWHWNGNPIQSATNSTYNLSDAGCYQVEVSEGGCSELSDTLCTIVGISEAKNNYNWTVFPNPFEDEFCFKLAGGQQLSFDIRIIDLMGREVWNGGNHLITTAVEHLSSQPSDLRPGLYFLTLASEDGLKTIPIRAK